jgi:hypothetical protein
MIVFCSEWDWKCEPDWQEITRRINEFKGPAYFTPVKTGGDSYAVIICDEPVMTIPKAQRAYETIKKL